MAVVRRAQQWGETGSRIEPRPAQPIDRAAIGHERGGLAVADQRVVFDPRRQGAPPLAIFSRPGGGAPPNKSVKKAPNAKQDNAFAPRKFTVLEHVPFLRNRAML